jgi:glycosyltransferase involved in cell wall biosynthesis
MISKINIIYLLPEMKGAAGGAKVIYNHSLILNRLSKKVESTILHIKKKIAYKIELSLAKKIKKLNLKLDSGWDGTKMKVSNNYSPSKKWHDKNVKIFKSLQFNRNKEFVILPEIFSHFAEDLNFKKRGIKYAIFVQGSHHTNSTNNYKKIKSSYENANIIIVSSLDGHNFISKIFPKCLGKIYKVNLSIDFINKKVTKKNFITCMPRKLPAHFNLLKFYLKDKLPGNWSFDPLDNIDYTELQNKINRSKIFLSFSHLEGLGLPPLEAAFAGNKVIGYDGGGGKEYWRKPIFHKINYGEINQFGEILLTEIKNYNKSWIHKTKKQREYLLKKYSITSEEKSLKGLSKKISNFF